MHTAVLCPTNAAVRDRRPHMVRRTQLGQKPDRNGYLAQIDKLVNTLGRPTAAKFDVQVGPASGDTSIRHPAVARRVDAVDE